MVGLTEKTTYMRWHADLLIHKTYTYNIMLLATYICLMYCYNYAVQLPKVVVNDDGVPEVSNSEKNHFVLSSFPLAVTMASINQYV